MFKAPITRFCSHLQTRPLKPAKVYKHIYKEEALQQQFTHTRNGHDNRTNLKPRRQNVHVFSNRPNCKLYDKNLEIEGKVGKGVKNVALTIS